MGSPKETCTNVALTFDTQEEAVEWIKKPRIERNKERLVNPLLKKMREMCMNEHPFEYDLRKALSRNSKKYYICRGSVMRIIAHHAIVVK